MHIFHKWSKWEEYQIAEPARQIASNWILRAQVIIRQKRKCLTCGKVQDELVTSYPAGSL